MKKILNLLLTIFLLLSSNHIYSQDLNMFYGFSIKSGDETPKYSQSIRFVNPKKEILSEVLTVFGDSYVKVGDVYEWKNVPVKGLSRIPLHIKITHEKYEFEEPVQGVKVDETFKVEILRKDKYFLHELKLANVHRLRKLFKPFAEHLAYE